jgi:glycine/D-amino acid oxidase-like deaminating enzyme
VQPALLARGLRRIARERGVRIFERSPMTGLERGRPPAIRTTGGRVVADRIVLALNAWAARLRELRRALLVVASDIVATAPMPEPPWDGGLSISDSRLLVNYYRTTLDGRLVFGRGGGAFAFAGRVGAVFEGPSPRAAEVEASMRSLYPDLAGVPVEASWSGPIDRTRTGLPFFGRLGGRPDILYAIGYSGNGVGPSYVGGRILASLALGLEDEWSRSGLVRDPLGSFPPEPVRYVGGLVVRAAVARKERAEDEGRAPSRLDTRLVSFAPAGLVPTRPPSPPPPSA